LESSYGAKVSFLDFVNNYEIALDTINQWVDNETQGKIPELIPKGLLNSSIKLVLVNTVYFKGSWQNPFDERLTVNRPFYLLDGSTIDVPTMTGTESVKYLEGKEFQAVSLPFVDQGSLAMVILLPNKGLFEKVEQEVTAGGLYSVIHHMQSGEVNLHIPKFYVRTNRKLNDDLTAMGMPDVFSSDTADLSGIDNGFGNLFISFVIHEAVVTVNEKGAEAAAATAAGGAGGGFPPPKPVEFIADHPFIYAIYDRTTDAVLFLGRILVPEQDKEAL
jgi:serpin B